MPNPTLYTSGWKYFRAHIYEGLIGLLALVTSLALLINPTALADSPIGRTLHPWDYGWAILYGASGALILWGLLRRKAELEGAGLVLQAATVSIIALVIMILGGVRGILSGAIDIALVAAALIRLYELHRPVELYR